MGSWFIQKDYRPLRLIGEGDWGNAAGIASPEFVPSHAAREDVHRPLVNQRNFHLVRDGEVMFEGVQYLSNAPDQLELGAPAYEFGWPVAGANEMQIKGQNGDWVDQPL